MKKLSLTTALALTLSLIAPANAMAAESPATPDTDAGAIAIPLTTENGELTDVAEQGFDIEATTDSPAKLTRALISAVTSALPQLASTLRVDFENKTEDLSEEYELFSAPIAIDDPFAVAAITWQSGNPFPEDATIEMRTLDGDQWSQWYELEAEECSPDAERCGSEYMISGSSTGIQARISRTSSSLPTDLRIDISYSMEGEETIIEEPELADTLPPSTSLTKSDIVLTSSVKDTSRNTNARNIDNSTKETYKNLGIITTQVNINQSLLANNKANIKPRSAWGANESLLTWGPEYVKFEGVIIHHTAGSNSYTQAQVPSVIQGIYRYHAVTLDWGDIGYNVLIDKYGGRWEGRYGTLSSPKNQMVIGGHARPRNERTMGISVMGDYTQVQPSATVITALSEVSAWKFIEANIDPASTSPLTIPAETGTMRNQVGQPLNRIVGHKDVGATACPGSIYDYLGQIRQNTRSLYQAGSTSNQITASQQKVSGNNVPMFRLYNPETREHLYTSDTTEVLANVRGAWNYEGVAWVAPKQSSQPIYRLYHPISKEHIYTADLNEIAILTEENSWKTEGIAWYSSTTTQQLPVYRQFNPDFVTGSHHFTTDLNEYNFNNSHGWQGEGIAWYANGQGWSAN